MDNWPPDEVSSFELSRTALDERVDKMLSPPVDIIKEDDSLSPESTNQLIRKTGREWNWFH
jgi:hypothetical protein